ASTTGPGPFGPGHPLRRARKVTGDVPGPSTERTHGRHHRLDAVPDGAAGGLDPGRGRRLVGPSPGVPVRRARRLLPVGAERVDDRDPFLPVVELGAALAGPPRPGRLDRRMD